MDQRLKENEGKSARLCMSSGLGLRIALSLSATIERLDSDSDLLGFTWLPIVMDNKNKWCLVNRNQILTIEPVD
jgi:hypothetical protein